jgi:hypothetical protein
MITLLIANEIDLKAFQLLDDETLKVIIPKIGTFLKFKEKFDDHKKNQNHKISNDSSTKRLNATQSNTPAKRLKKDIDFCIGLDLENLLQSTKKGELVLQNKDKLINKDRQHLCQIIVDHFVNNNISMGLVEFQLMKEKIGTCFPSESSNLRIYYVKPEGSTKKAKGRLAERYFNYTNLLKKHDILESKKISRNTGSFCILL